MSNPVGSTSFLDLLAEFESQAAICAGTSDEAAILHLAVLRKAIRERWTEAYRCQELVEAAGEWNVRQVVARNAPG